MAQKQKSGVASYPVSRIDERVWVAVRHEIGSGDWPDWSTLRVGRPYVADALRNQKINAAWAERNPVVRIVEVRVIED